MTIFNYALDNGLLFWGAFSATAGFMGYSLISSYFNSSYIDKGIQTDAWDDYSDRPSQIIQVSEISSQNITPNFSPVDNINTGAQVGLDTVEAGIQTISESVSTATTVLPIPPVNIEMIPNPDIIILQETLYHDMNILIKLQL